jgi:hypothetical protein
MGPFRNTALESAKVSILEQSPSFQLYHASTSTLSSEEIAAPPAYETVVHCNMPLSSVPSPYTHLEEEEEFKEVESDTPEIVINAATQIRGHGNIISIAQMDSVRIANLITSLLSRGDKTQSIDDETRPLTPPSPVTPPTAQAERTSRTQVRGVPKYPNINITVNCGATVIGDRNIVGPGLGDIARQMQMAQRNQAALQAQQQQQQRQTAAAAATAAAVAAAEGQKMASPPMQRSSTLYQTATAPLFCAQAPVSNGVATPPMSRSSSLHSDGECRKRKGADGCEVGGVKRRC